MKPVDERRTASRFRAAPSALALSLAALLLAACAARPGLDIEAQDVISGDLVAPEGHDVQGTELRLCSDTACLEQQVVQSGQMATFEFEGVEPGTYELTAFKSISEASFLAGCHGTSGTDACEPAAIAPPQRAADIELNFFELPQPPEPPPVD